MGNPPSLQAIGSAAAIEMKCQPSKQSGHGDRFKQANRRIDRVENGSPPQNGSIRTTPHCVPVSGSAQRRATYDRLDAVVLCPPVERPNEEDLLNQSIIDKEDFDGSKRTSNNEGCGD
jgi:hypothetical protein